MPTYWKQVQCLLSTNTAIIDVVEASTRLLLQSALSIRLPYLPSHISREELSLLGRLTLYMSESALVATKKKSSGTA